MKLLRQLFCLTLAFALAGTAVAKEVIKVGISSPLTGNAAWHGAAHVVALKMMKAELKTRDTMFEYQFFIEDDGLVPRQALLNFNRLRGLDGVDGIISFFGAQGKVIAPLAERYQMPHIAINWTPSVAQSKTTFIHWTPAQREAEVWLDAYKTVGAPPIAALCARSDGPMAGFDAAKIALEGAGYKFTNIHYFVFGERDFKTLLMRVLESKPKMILVMALSPEIDIIRNQLRVLDPGVALTTLDYFALTSEPELFEGMWFACGAMPTAEFSKEFEKHGTDSVNLRTGAYMHDALGLMVDAFERAGKDTGKKPTGEQVVAALGRTREFHGSMGFITAGANRAFDSPAALMMIKNGKPEEISLSALKTLKN